MILHSYLYCKPTLAHLPECTSLLECDCEQHLNGSSHITYENLSREFFSIWKTFFMMLARRRGEDATEFMKSAASRHESWDLVILDPPKLAPRRKSAASMASRKVTVLCQAGAACAHPIDPSYPEGAYLSNVFLRVL